MGRLVDLGVEDEFPADRNGAADVRSPAEGADARAAGGVVTRSSLQRETTALSASIVRIISSGSWDALLPNSGNSVVVGDHHVCVSYDVVSSAEYRTWEWQGHILLYDEEAEMYVPEYVYGNYFEPLLRTDSVYENFLDRPPYGLTGTISNIQRRLNQSN